ncbi:hypothetical protein [Shewanella atlantica]|uniref:Uncharacterized protein n=1 Tax=Shewanella atlantica TaxID=271099 RepID=A0A431VV27_9GAMM|nr:hypothetical protein [Shewanella atlantica]RTR27005.1 hypothetical protein EKG39_21070 [Shewanella atlantica]
MGNRVMILTLTTCLFFQGCATHADVDRKVESAKADNFRSLKEAKEYYVQLVRTYKQSTSDKVEAAFDAAAEGKLELSKKLEAEANDLKQKLKSTQRELEKIEGLVQNNSGDIKINKKNIDSNSEALGEVKESLDSVKSERAILQSDINQRHEMSVRMSELQKKDLDDEPAKLYSELD